ncbi:MAG TPA: hypothetical protein VLA13_03495 [Massilibacterium sp.]|nr:hypothetical protein [Massilibacterium sp.]
MINELDAKIATEDFDYEPWIQIWSENEVQVDGSLSVKDMKRLIEIMEGE